MPRSFHYGEKTLGYLKSQSFINPHSGCWEWQRGRTNIGYGQVWFRNKVEKAHRASFMLAKGDIPKDREIDHLCFTRACINPDHLRLVTHKENCRSTRKAKSLFCKRGHEYTEKTLFMTKKETRVCKVCRYENVRRWIKRNPSKARELWRGNKRRKKGKMQTLANMTPKVPDVALNVLDNSVAQIEA
jgi:hypothetical protein